ncbi:hypothetical protein Anapl_11839 [Anas platyrhynchos]|uniref:Uncharacterized protein n=1 Tax=Anas platyrhynchos TaxID=8839 RepID=R0L4M5_ANAPL|nr:hypothetical protein Anapl_11839 [Anas platyrhynchos]
MYKRTVASSKGGEYPAINTTTRIPKLCTYTERQKSSWARGGPDTENEKVWGITGKMIELALTWGWTQPSSRTDISPCSWAATSSSEKLYINCRAGNVLPCKLAGEVRAALLPQGSRYSDALSSSTQQKTQSQPGLPVLQGTPLEQGWPASSLQP